MAGISAPSAASAQVDLEFELTPSVGIDTNPGLARDPNARGAIAAVPLSGTLGVDVALGVTWLRGDWAIQVSPFGTAQLLSPGEGWANGGLLLKLGRDLHARRLLASLGGQLYGASYGRDNAGLLAGELGISRAFDEIEISGFMQVRYRHYVAAEQRDRRLGMRGQLLFPLKLASMSVSLGVDRRWSTAEAARRWEARLLAEVTRVWGAWQLRTGAAVYGRWFQVVDRDGAELELHVQVARSVAAHSVFGRVLVGAARGQTHALRYSRLAVQLGVRFGWLSPPHAPRRQGPAHLTSDGVLFRVHAPGAESVLLLASFRDWNTENAALHPVGDGYFEGTFAVPPGRHRYRFIVDDETVVPEGAGAYRTDGFGGRDAILEVPE